MSNEAKKVWTRGEIEDMLRTQDGAVERVGPERLPADPSSATRPRPVPRHRRRRPRKVSTRTFHSEESPKILERPAPRCRRRRGPS